jgi:hypothetical protein
LQLVGLRFNSQALKKFAAMFQVRLRQLAVVPEKIVC